MIYILCVGCDTPHAVITTTSASVSATTTSISTTDTPVSTTDTPFSTTDTPFSTTDTTLTTSDTTVPITDTTVTTSVTSVTTSTFVHTPVTYYVAVTGSDNNPGTSAQPWLTIQYAINNAVAGDTVNITAGNYITTGLKCTHSGSASGGYITFQNIGVVNITINDIYYIGISTNGNNYLKFIGLNITGNDATRIGIYPYQSDHITIQNCYITNTRSSGIQPYESSYVTIDGCEIVNCCKGYSEENISVVQCDHFEIMNCKVHDPGSEQRLGIDLKVGCTNGSVHNNEVYNLPGMWNGGIYIDAQGVDSHNIQIYNNLVHDVPLGAGFSIGDEQAATNPSHISNIDVYNNIAYNCGEEGLIITQRSTETFTNINIFNNTFYNCTSYSAYSPVLNMYQLDPAYINNIVIRNNIGYSTNQYAIPIHDPLHCYDSGKLIADHNLWYNPAGWFISTESIKGDSYLETDPLFINAPNDFHLQSNSPAQDGGSISGAPATNYDGTIRQHGTGYDIGAY